MVDLFEERVRLAPLDIAVVNADGDLSYQELNIAANKIANRLIEEGIGPGAFVGIWSMRSLELVIGLLGILKSGAAYVPLDPSLPVGRLQVICRQAAPRVILRPCVQRLEYPALGVAEWDVSSAHSGSKGEDNPSEGNRHQCPTGDSAAYVVFTSGSTGTPKGVVASHRGIVRLVKSPNYMRLDATVRMLQLAPVSFDAATLEIWGPLLNGGSVVLAPDGLLSLLDVSRCVSRYSINALWLSAGLFHALVDSELNSLGGLAQLLAGGDVLSPDHVRRFRDANARCRLINGYGPSEVTTFATCYTIPTDVARDRPVPIGRPINETQVLVLDHNLHLLPVGAIGEIYLGGAGLALGYAGAPALTAARFVANPHSSVPGERMYRTGDLGRWRPDGNLEFLGRSDQQVKVRGFRIELQEIEIALRSIPGVAQAAVVAHGREAADVHLIAYIVPVPGSMVTWSELQVALTGNLPEYMIPTAGMLMNSFPLTPNGKLDRRSLPLPKRGSDPLAPPQSPEEERLCQAFESVLHHSKVGRNDHFFKLGGNSLLAVRLIAIIQRDLGEELPVRSVFHHPTPAELARELAMARKRRVDCNSNPTMPLMVWFDPVPWSLSDWPSDLAMSGRHFPDFPVEKWTIDHNAAYARLYLEQLRSTPAETPLFLGGYCRIGYIAYEAACQLSDAGRPPAGVILVDSMPPSRIVYWVWAMTVSLGKMWGASPGRTALRTYRLLRLIDHADRNGLVPSHWIEKSWKAIMQLLSSGRWSPRQPEELRGVVKSAPDNSGIFPHDPIAADANVYWQLGSFTCRKFEGPVSLVFSAETPAAIRRASVRRWRAYCRHVTVHETPGDHESCVRGDAGHLAAEIVQCMRMLIK